MEKQELKLNDLCTWTDWIYQPLPHIEFVYGSSGASNRHLSYHPTTVRKWEKFREEVAAHIEEFTRSFKVVEQVFRNKLDEGGYAFREELAQGWLRRSNDFDELLLFSGSTHGDFCSRFSDVLRGFFHYAPFQNWKMQRSTPIQVTVTQEDRGAEPPAGASTESEPSALAGDESNAAESGRAESSAVAEAAHATRIASDRKYPDLSVKNEKGEICLVIECKAPGAIRNSCRAAIPDLLSTNAGRLQEAIRQVVKYITSKKTGYAILSSDDLTYFFRVVGAALEISDGHTRTELLQAIHYVLFLSKDTTNVQFDAYEEISVEQGKRSRRSSEPSTGDEQRRGKRTKQGQGTGDPPTQHTHDLEEMQVQNLHLGKSPHATGSSGNLVLGKIEGQKVVIKLAPVDDPRAERLLREAEVYLRLQDLWGTVVPTLVSWGSTVNGTLVYLATEFIEGLTLGQALITNEVMAATFEGLAAVHAHGILHGDIHAKNILVAKTGVRIIDFGLSEDNICPAKRRLELEELQAVLQDLSLQVLLTHG